MSMASWLLCDLNHKFAVRQGYGFRVSIIQPYMTREYADHRQVQRPSAFLFSL
jgi:hypothetical protein